MSKHNMQIATPSGQTIDIALHGSAGRVVVDAWLNGKKLQTGMAHPTPIDKYPANIQAKARQAGGTHMLGPIVLDNDNAAKLNKAIADFAASDPEIVEARLRSERQRLASDYAACVVAAGVERDRAWSHEDERGGVVANEWDAKAQKALAELHAFDARHPEVIAAIRAESDKAAERAMWQ